VGWRQQFSSEFSSEFPSDSSQFPFPDFRSSFNVMWQRMVNKLNNGKRHIMDLVEQATNAFDQREELCTKLQILKERGQNDRSCHVQEMRELQRKLDHDAKLQEFLAIKGQQRLNTEQQEREADKKKKRLEEIERQFVEYDKIFQRIVVSIYHQTTARSSVERFPIDFRCSLAKKKPTKSFRSSSKRKRRTMRCSITLTS
jgi:hypothetical protein